MRISRLVVHQNPHLDELFAVWLLRNYGEEKFPGVKTAEIVVWGKKELLANPPEVALAQGSLCLGLGGGMFDEHGRNGHRREDCAATLVAKYLGLMNDPVIGFLAKGVFLEDANNEGPFKSLAEEVKNLNRYWPGSMNLEQLYKLVETLICSRMMWRQEYLEAGDLFRKRFAGWCAGVKVAGGAEINNRQYQHVARKEGVQLIVQRNSDGLTQILGHESLDMPGLMIRVRKAEIYFSQLRFRRILKDEELAEQGTMPEIPQWHLDGNNLLNGSESFQDTPPSRIPIQKLFEIVEKHLTELARAMLRPREQEKVSELVSA